MSSWQISATLPWPRTSGGHLTINNNGGRKRRVDGQWQRHPGVNSWMTRPAILRNQHRAFSLSPTAENSRTYSITGSTKSSSYARFPFYEAKPLDQPQSHRDQFIHPAIRLCNFALLENPSTDVIHLSSSVIFLDISWEGTILDARAPPQKHNYNELWTYSCPAVKCICSERSELSEVVRTCVSAGTR